MKIAISGKGGVGKTTIAASLALLFAQENKKVIAIDADPDSNLASTLGYPDPEKIVPIIEMEELIKERTGTDKNIGSFFAMNPDVKDIPEKYAVEYRGVKILVMGGLKKGGSGCFCPENNFLKSLLTHLLIARDEVVIIDMEAGIEHLTRGTASVVDGLIVVAEPTKRSTETAERIKKLATDLGIKNVFMVGNKIRKEGDKEFLRYNNGGLQLLGLIDYSDNTVDRIHSVLLNQVKKIRDELSQRLI